ncbi:MAG: SDR family oxidoreductase [Vicinamibacterales bacterium]
MSLYLVTGGAGFIGSHLAEALLKRGDTVRIVDNFSSGKKANLRPGAEVIEGDLADDGVAARAVAGCEYVLHEAAVPSVPRSVKDPLGTHRANVDGTIQLLVAARDAGVKRLVFAGSSSTYGNSTVLPKREDMRASPITPYAMQKHMGEQYCQLFTSLYGLETVTTRYFNVFGPRQSPDSPYSGVISLFVKALLAGQSPVLHGDGRQTRDFTYVANVVDGVLRAATADKVSGEVINIATGGRISLLELVRQIQLILGSNVAPMFTDVREGDVKDSQADIFKARKMLGYEPTVPFEEGLRRTVAWFKALTD